jgi:hypothetical protein
MTPPRWEYKNLLINVSGWLGPNIDAAGLDEVLNRTRRGRMGAGQRVRHQSRPRGDRRAVGDVQATAVAAARRH